MTSSIKSWMSGGSLNSVQLAMVLKNKGLVLQIETTVLQENISAFTWDRNSV